MSAVLMVSTTQALLLHVGLRACSIAVRSHTSASGKPNAGTLTIFVDLMQIHKDTGTGPFGAG